MDGSASAPYAGFTGSDRPVTLPDNSFEPQAGLGVAWELDFWGRFRRNTEAAQAELLASEDARYRRDGHAGYGGRPGVSDPPGAGSDARNLPAHRHLAEAVARPRPGPAATAAWPGYSICGRPRRCSTARRRRSPRSSARSSRPRTSSTSCSGRIRGRSSAGARSRQQIAAPALPPGLPSDLLARRPDIRRAEQQLVAANAQIGVAKALLYPQITISGFAGAGGATINGSSFGPYGIFSVLAGDHPAHLQHGTPAGQRRIQRGARPGSGPALPADAAAGVPRSVGRAGRHPEAAGISAAAGTARQGSGRTPARSRTCATRAACPATWKSWIRSASCSTRSSSWSRRSATSR